MAFNLLRKQAEAPKHTEEYLREHSDGLNRNYNTDTGNINYELEKVEETHNNREANQPFNSKLEEMRTGTNDGITEKALNQNEDLYNTKRTDKAYATRVKSNDLVSESFDQKRRNDHIEAESAQDRDTSFWDDYVGDQMIGKKTTISKNDQPSQLQNHPDRFKGLDKSMDVQKENRDESFIGKKDKVEKMVAACLNRADAMLFTIYAHAETEERDINEREQQQVADINSGKARLLAVADGKLSADAGSLGLNS